jgi:hypothetical protein
LDNSSAELCIEINTGENKIKAFDEWKSKKHHMH